MLTIGLKVAHSSNLDVFFLSKNVLFNFNSSFQTILVRGRELMKEDLHSAVAVEYTPRKIQANIFIWQFSSYNNGYAIKERIVRQFKDTRHKWLNEWIIYLFSLAKTIITENILGWYIVGSRGASQLGGIF